MSCDPFTHAAKRMPLRGSPTRASSPCVRTGACRQLNGSSQTRRSGKSRIDDDGHGIICEEAELTHTQLSTRAFWICAIITVASAVVSASFSVVALLGVARQDQYALYAASRSIALLIASLACIGARSRHGVMALALTMGLVQGLDAFVGLVGHDAAKTYGPLVLSVVGLASLVALHRDAGAQTEPASRAAF
jgi:hypothetical protein